MKKNSKNFRWILRPGRWNLTHYLKCGLNIVASFHREQCGKEGGRKGNLTMEKPADTSSSQVIKVTVSTVVSHVDGLCL